MSKQRRNSTANETQNWNIENSGQKQTSWHKPDITRIKLSRTLLGEGQYTDGETTDTTIS